MKVDIYKSIESNNTVKNDITRLVKERNSLVKKLQISTERLKSLELDLENARKNLNEFSKASYYTMMEPIRVATTYTDMLKLMKNGWNNKERPYITIIEDCHKRLYNIAQKLQQYTIVNNQLNLCEIDLNDLIDEVVDVFSEQLKDVNGYVTVDQLCNIKADPMHIRLLYQNIIENAIVYHDKNRSLHIHIGMVKNDGDEILFVKDTGIGIESEYCREIFNLFTRLDTFKQHAGSGLGLAICKSVVETYSGKIWARSSPGSGSTFCFTINLPVYAGVIANQVCGFENLAVI